MVIITKKQTSERPKNDFYPTPYELAYEMVIEKAGIRPTYALDPGCGYGVFGHAIRDGYPHSEKTVIHGVDLEKREWMNGINPYSSFYNKDFSIFNSYFLYDLIIGNPPYSHAEMFIRKSRELLSDNGRIVFLLKLAFLESKKRCRGLWQEFPPTEVSVLAGRPSFNNTGKTNDYAFAVFIWDMQDRDHETVLTWFDWN